MKRKKKGLWLHPPKRVKLSKDQNESTESRDSTTTNTQTTTPVNPPNYRFSIYNSPWSSAGCNWPRFKCDGRRTPSDSKTESSHGL